MKKTSLLIWLACFAQVAGYQTLAQVAPELPKNVRVKIVGETDDKTEIKVVNFSSYIAGVISKEMPLSWPIEALKAQAVVARNFALYKMNINQNKDFDVRNDIWDQVFQPTDHVKAIKAASDTKEIRLTDENGKIEITPFEALTIGDSIKIDAKGYESLILRVDSEILTTGKLEISMLKSALATNKIKYPSTFGA